MNQDLNYKELELKNYLKEKKEKLNMTGELLETIKSQNATIDELKSHRLIMGKNVDEIREEGNFTQSQIDLLTIENDELAA